jgi:hypothetical protein
MRPTILLLLCVYSLPLKRIAEPLPSNIHIERDLCVEFKKYAFRMGSDAIIYISSFIKFGSGSQKLIGWYTETHRQKGDRINLL